MNKFFEKSNKFDKVQGKDSGGIYYSDEHKKFAELCKNCGKPLNKHIPTNDGLLGKLEECFCPSA